LVSVPSQRSATYQRVPRTVMTALLARVRKRPWLSWPHSTRGGRLLAAAARAVPAGRRGDLPRSTSSVSPCASAGWRTWKTPPWKVPVCVAPPDSAVVSASVPWRVSTIEPTGTRDASCSAVGAAAPGTRTKTWPLPAATVMLWPSSGVAAGGSDGMTVC
jgi:hypothetical protein